MSGKKKGQQQKGQPAKAAAATAKEPANPVKELVWILLSQAEAKILGKQALSSDARDKSVKALEAVARGIPKDPKHTELQRYAVLLSTHLQINSGLDGAKSKRIVSVFFTYLVSEMQRNWRDYGFKEEEVHPDHVVSQDEIEINAQFETKDEDGNPKGPFWIPDCDTKEHSSWQLAFKFLCT